MKLKITDEQVANSSDSVKALAPFFNELLAYHATEKANQKRESQPPEVARHPNRKMMKTFITEIFGGIDGLIEHLASKGITLSVRQANDIGAFNRVAVYGPGQTIMQTTSIDVIKALKEKIPKTCPLRAEICRAWDRFHADRLADEIGAYKDMKSGARRKEGTGGQALSANAGSKSSVFGIPTSPGIKPGRFGLDVEADGPRSSFDAILDGLPKSRRSR